MRSRRLVLAAALAAAVVVLPSAAFAQQMPQAPDGTSINEAPAAGPAAAVDACGNTPQEAFGNTLPNGMPTDINTLYPKDVTGAQQLENMSQVTGFVVHTSGNLILLQLPLEAANGLANPNTPDTPDHTMAVVRLPDGCFPAISDGQQVKAIGTPTMQGILNAERVQVAD